VDVLAYVISSLSILWAFGGGHLSEVFWVRVLIAAPICLIMALLLLYRRNELKNLKAHDATWMMGVGLGFAMLIIALLVTWFFKNRTLEINELKDFKILGLLAWAFILAPSCEIIYRKVLAPSWGTKSSAFIEALNFGVGAVSLYLFCITFIWGYFASKINMKFGILASMMARSIATLLLILSLKAL
jgi:hypothetical protein